MTDPYRKPGEPAPVPKELRRWFTKSGDLEKGPFEASAVRRSLKEGYIKPTTLVRGEDEREWRELSSVAELSGRVVAPRITLPPEPSSLPLAQPLSPGSFWGGFAATICFGLLALIIVFAAVKEPETRRGAVRGFFVRLGLTVVVIVFSLATR